MGKKNPLHTANLAAAQVFVQVATFFSRLFSWWMLDCLLAQQLGEWTCSANSTETFFLQEENLFEGYFRQS